METIKQHQAGLNAVVVSLAVVAMTTLIGVQLATGLLVPIL